MPKESMPDPAKEWAANKARWNQHTHLGLEAARLIMTAPTLQQALDVHWIFLRTKGRTYSSTAHWSFLYRITFEKGDATMLKIAQLIVNETAKRSEFGLPDDFIIDDQSDEAEELTNLYWKARKAREDLADA